MHGTNMEKKGSLNLIRLRLIAICQCIPILVKIRQEYQMLHENTDLNTFLGILRELK
jgi:hypothetical protein